jgi:CRP-like cAMP-binding protein
VLGLHTRSRGDAKLERIAGVPLFSDLTTSELKAVAREADELAVPAGHRLIRQGATGHEFIVVLEGEAVVQRDGESLCRLGPGDYTGEISLLTHRPRTATVTTTTPARVLVISDHGFHRVVDEVPRIAIKLLPAFGNHVANYLAA